MNVLLRLIALVVMINMTLTGLSLASNITFERAQSSYDAGDYQIAELIWRELAGKGDEDSMFALGALLLEGPGDIAVDQKASSAWFLQAAELGQPEAQYNLGNAYQKALGVPQDDEQAAYWWKRAADQGMPNAAYNMGVQYMYGRGVPQDFQLALEMFQFAAARNHTAAQKLLLSWNFEIPELAGTAAGDADRLAGMMSGESNQAGTSQAGQADPVSTQAATSPPVQAPAQPTVGDSDRLAGVTSAEATQAGAVDPVLTQPATSPPVQAPAQPTVVASSVYRAEDDTEPSVTPGVDEYEFASADTLAAEDIGSEPEPDTPVVPAEPLQQTQAVDFSSIAQPVSVADEAVEKYVSQAEPENLAELKQPAVAVAGAGSALTANESYILEASPGSYTLQLTAMSKPENLEKFIRQFELTGDLHRYRYVKGTNKFYALSIGEFGSRAEAIAFREQLSARGKPGWKNPWLRRFSEIQQLVRNLQSADQ